MTNQAMKRRTPILDARLSAASDTLVDDAKALGVEKETLLERIETAMLQAEWMVAFKGERLGIVEMRKHVGHYINGLRGATTIRRKVNFMTTLEEMRSLLLELRACAEEEEV